jgi:aspartate/methionine/tyrosine aminotransferase
MEGLVDDGGEVIHPVSFPQMRDRMVTVGSVSLEYRMIGWRVGWIVADTDTETADAAGLVHVYNGIVTGGFGQAGALTALRAPEADFRAAVAELQRRRDVMVEQLAGLPVVRPEGGCSLLLDTDDMGVPANTASQRLLDHKVAATPMTVWRERVAPRHVRLVFSNEPVERLELLGERGRRALTSATTRAHDRPLVPTPLRSEALWNRFDDLGLAETPAHEGPTALPASQECPRPTLQRRACACPETPGRGRTERRSRAQRR